MKRLMENNYRWAFCLMLMVWCFIGGFAVAGLKPDPPKSDYQEIKDRVLNIIKENRSAEASRN